MLARQQAAVDAFASVLSNKLTDQIYLADAVDGPLVSDHVPINEAGGTQIGTPILPRLQSIKFRDENASHISLALVVPPSGRLALNSSKDQKDMC